MSQKSSNQGELHRSLGFTTALAIGVGTMIAAGIFTLSGLAIRNVGSSAIISFVLAAFVSLFTALTYCEFVSIYPKSGEGYLYARKTYVAPVAYLVGIALFLGYISSCSFYLSSLSTYFQEFVWHTRFEKLSGVVFLIALILLNVKGSKESGTFQVVVTFAKVVLLIWFIFGGLRFLSIDQVLDKVSTDIVQIVQTSSLVFITFFGFSAIAASAGEVKNPVKNIPKAIFWSMGIVSILYILVVLVIITSDLTEYNEAAMGMAAKKFLGNIGGMVIVGGGIFSMISASNASIMAGSRVALAMSDLGHLPKVIGKIHPSFNTPWISVLGVGGLILLFTVLLPLEDLAHFADTVLLFALIMVNIALIIHRRRFPHLERPFRVPLYPLTPIIGIIANLYLFIQLLSHPMPLSLALFTIAVGIVGFLYWKGTLPDEEGFEGEPSKLVIETHAPDEKERSKTIIVPIYNPNSIADLIGLAANLAKEQDASVTALHVVKIDENEPLKYNFNDFSEQSELLQKAQEASIKYGLTLGTMIRIGHDAARAILEAAREIHADIIILGWKGSASTSHQIMGNVIDTVSTLAKRDIIIFRSGKGNPIEKILLPSGGGTHAKAAEIFGGGLAKAVAGSITVMRVVTQYNLSEEEQAEEIAQLDESKKRIEKACGVNVASKLIHHPHISSAVKDESASYDTVIIGATRNSMYHHVLFGAIPETLAKELDTNIILVKHYSAFDAVWGKVLSEKK